MSSLFHAFTLCQVHFACLLRYPYLPFVFDYVTYQLKRLISNGLVLEAQLSNWHWHLAVKLTTVCLHQSAELSYNRIAVSEWLWCTIVPTCTCMYSCGQCTVSRWLLLASLLLSPMSVHIRLSWISGAVSRQAFCSCCHIPKWFVWHSLHIVLRTMVARLQLILFLEHFSYCIILVCALWASLLVCCYKWS